MGGQTGPASAWRDAAYGHCDAGSSAGATAGAGSAPQHRRRQAGADLTNRLIRASARCQTRRPHAATASPDQRREYDPHPWSISRYNAAPIQTPTRSSRYINARSHGSYDPSSLPHHQLYGSEHDYASRPPRFKLLDRALRPQPAVASAAEWLLTRRSCTARAAGVYLRASGHRQPRHWRHLFTRSFEH